jgi:hypothetical protein
MRMRKFLGKSSIPFTGLVIAAVNEFENDPILVFRLICPGMKKIYPP